MKVSIAICTWNRAALLDKTLAQLQRLNIPHGVGWEVLVVNNNCTDDTNSVVQRHVGRLPLRGLFEPQPGLSNARNCAVDAAAGDLLLWTDDDVLVDRDWVAAYLDAADRFRDAAFFGGLIEPWFEVPPPAWLTAMLSVPGIAGAYALRSHRDAPDRFDQSGLADLPYGANFAVRTDVQRQFRFDPRLGRTETDTLSCEETLVLRGMITGGHHGRWVAGAGVQHFLGKERLTVDYLRRFFVGLGRSNQRIAGPIQDGSRARIRAGVQYAELMYRLNWAIKNHRQCARHLIHGSQLRGKILEQDSGAERAPISPD